MAREQADIAGLGRDAVDGRPTVLVVDDEAFMRVTFRAGLEAVGCHVMEAHGGEEALALVPRVRPQLVILDLVMEGMDGFATCEALRRLDEGRHVPVLAVTGLQDAGAIHRAFEAGATDFIAKPVSAELLGYRAKFLLRAGQAMADLSLSEARLARARRIAGLGHWEWDLASGQVWWSEEMSRILGLDGRPSSGFLRAYLSLVHPEDRSRVTGILRETFRHQTPHEIEHRLVRPDGTAQVVYGQAEFWREAPAAPMRLCGTLQDITRRRNTEDRLQLLKAAVESLPIGITISDDDGRIIYANPAEAAMHGYQVEELLNQEAGLLAPDRLHREWTPGELENGGGWQRESVNRRRSGEEFPVRLLSVPVRNPKGGWLGTITACEEISERKRYEEKIQELAYYDTLTGLPNRWLFHDRLRKALALAERKGWQVAVLFLDLDNFKDVNDTQGHDFGDRLLQAVGARLAECTREADTLARLGGDEFVVLLTVIDGREKAILAADRILEAFRCPFEIEGRRIYSGISIGVSLYPRDAGDLEGLLRSADTAMFHAKAQGRQNFQFFSPRMNKQIVEKVAMESELRQALGQKEFRVDFQPQWDLRAGVICGVEALIRWHHPRRGNIPPAQFIPLAENSGLIFPLGEWALRAACGQARTWIQEGLPVPRVAVNISGRQLRQPDFVEMVEAILDEARLEPDRLELEFTESVFMDPSDRSLTSLKALKAKGIHLSIDDFGTGYSSLGYLKHFPVDRIKIDRSFIASIESDPGDTAIVAAIIALAKTLKVRVLAEGVETRSQLDFLRRHGCCEAQGHFLGVALPAADLARVLRQMTFPTDDLQYPVT